MMKPIIFFGIIVIFWCISFYIYLKILKRYKDTGFDQIIVSALNYRRILGFSFFSLLVLGFFDINFLTWIGIVYYVVISVTEFILIIISLFPKTTEEKLQEATDIKLKNLNSDMNLLKISKVLNEIISILMIFQLYNILN